MTTTKKKFEETLDEKQIAALEKNFTNNLRRLEEKKDKNGITKKITRTMGETGRRINLLRNVLDLTLEDMARLCNLHLGKFTRLENCSTQLTREDAIRICVAVLKNYCILIKPEWLLGATMETPVALISTDEVKRRVAAYTKENLFNRDLMSTMTIFLEMETFSRIYGKGVVFAMVSDNRLNKYEKGDYVGGMLSVENSYYLVNVSECIVALKKDPDIKFIRIVYFKYPQEGEKNKEVLVLLCTDTREPEIFRESDIDSIAMIFYHRKNSEDFIKVISLLTAAADSNGTNGTDAAPPEVNN